MTTAREDTTRLAELLKREHLAMADFLVALAAFDEARGWADMGYRSLFYFLLRELGLPKGPAYYRMTAAGLIRKYPELVEPLRDGRLHLSSVTQLARVITPENRAEVPSRFFHLSKREAKEVVAELVPAAAPPLRTVVTQVRSAAQAPTSAALVLPDEPAPAHPGQTRHMGEAPEIVPPPPRQQRAQVDPLTAEKSRLHVTVSRRLLEKLSAAQDALSHSHPGASEETIIEVGLDLILQRHAKRRGLGAKPRRPLPPSPPAGERTGERGPSRSRLVPAHVWRAVWKRDRGCCAWPLANGGVCASTDQIELDHVNGWALGAGTTVEETRLLCRWHQDVSARQLYGNDLMNNFTKPKGPGCSEPIAEYGAARTSLGERAVFAGGPDHAGPVPPRGAASAGAAPSMLRPRHRFGFAARAGRGRRLEGRQAAPARRRAAHPARSPCEQS